MRPSLLLTVSLGLMLGMACAHAIPHPGPYVWHLRGAVVSVTNDVLRVQHKTGGIVELQIDDRTVYTKNKQPDSRRSLIRGIRVMVDVENRSGPTYRARRIQLFGGGHTE